MGRPTDYKPEFCVDAEKLCKLGATDKQMAEFFDVAESTLNLWKQKYPEFSESIKKGKIVADAQVANSLFKKATGYVVEMEKVVGKGDEKKVLKYNVAIEPDTVAAIFWLKNRQPEQWRDKMDHDVNHKLSLTEEFEGFIRGMMADRSARVIEAKSTEVE